MEEGKRDSRIAQKGKRNSKGGEMGGEAHKQRPGIQEHSKPSGRKIEGWWGNKHMKQR